MRNPKGQFVKGHEEGVRFGSGQSLGDKSKYIKIGLAQIGKKVSLETRNKMSTSATGRVTSEATKKKLSLISKKNGNKPPVNYGENNVNWKGGIAKVNDMIRHSIEGELWRDSVFARDGYTCQITGIKGINLVAHHILNFAQYPDLRTSIENGITLSKEIHLAFHKKYGRKNNTREQLVEFANTYDGFIIGQNA